MSLPPHHFDYQRTCCIYGPDAPIHQPDLERLFARTGARRGESATDLKLDDKPMRRAYVKGGSDTSTDIHARTRRAFEALPDPREIEREVAQKLPALCSNPTFRRTATLLYAAARAESTSDTFLAQWSGYSRGFTMRRIRLLKATGVWPKARGGKPPDYVSGPHALDDLQIDVKIAERELEPPASSRRG